MNAMFLIIGGACFLVGMCIGWCGVAGFLLPLLFISYCGYSSDSSLFLSFSCFFISGLIGAYNYHRRGNLPVKTAAPLMAGSLAGAFLGAVLGRIYVTSYITVVLYIVVLFSGLMIFVQDVLTRGTHKDREIKTPVLVILGFLTAIICALSGAGGPVIVMPLLVVLGLPIRMAVGTALLDSVSIAIPSILVYGMQADIGIIGIAIPVALLAHGAGIYLGSKTASRIPQRPLKLGVAAFSVIFALLKLF